MPLTLHWHPGYQQTRLAPTEVIEVKASACICGQTEGLDTSPYYTHQVIELPEIQMTVRHFVLYQAYPPQGGKVTKTQVPLEASTGQGPRLTALFGDLSDSQRAGRSAVQAFSASVLGIPISRGAIQRAVDRLSEAIEPHNEAIAEKARQAMVNDINETAWYQHGVLAWLWVMVNTTVAFFKVQASRSKATFEDLVECWAAILVSDGYGVYYQWMHTRQTCLAHLIRRARGLTERKDPELAWFGHRLWTEWQRLVHWAIVPPTSGEVQTWYAHMVHLLRHRRERQDVAGAFARTLERELGALWTFLVEQGVEPTNNRAERALRFLEWRWGRRMSLRGHNRDPLASSLQRSVAASGLRWIDLTPVIASPRPSGHVNEHLYASLMAYNFAKRLKTLKGLTPYEYVCQRWQQVPDRFTINPYHRTLELYIYVSCYAKSFS
jgi:transposase